MYLTVSKTERVVKATIVDALLLSVICAVPAISHVLSFPLYKLNPMAMCLLAGMLLVKDHRNAFLLAILMPLVSMLVTGFPIIDNTACMIPELMTVVALMCTIDKKMPSEVSMFLSLLGGKIVFYTLRALFFSPAVLFGTSILLQISVLIVLSMVYGFIVRKR